MLWRSCCVFLMSSLLSYNLAHSEENRLPGPSNPTVSDTLVVLPRAKYEYREVKRLDTQQPIRSVHKTLIVGFDAIYGRYYFGGSLGLEESSALATDVTGARVMYQDTDAEILAAYVGFVLPFDLFARVRGRLHFQDVEGFTTTTGAFNQEKRHTVLEGRLSRAWELAPSLFLTPSLEVIHNMTRTDQLSTVGLPAPFTAASGRSTFTRVFVGLNIAYTFNLGAAWNLDVNGGVDYVKFLELGNGFTDEKYFDAYFGLGLSRGDTTLSFSAYQWLGNYQHDNRGVQSNLQVKF